MARAFVPRASILPSPFEDVKATVASCETAREFVQRAPVLPCPFQDVEVTIFSCDTARDFVPRASVLPSPLEDAKVITPSTMGNWVVRNGDQRVAVFDRPMHFSAVRLPSSAMNGF